MGLRFRGWGFSIKGVLVAEFISPESVCAFSSTRILHYPRIQKVSSALIQLLRLRTLRVSRFLMSIVSGSRSHGVGF